MKGLIEEYLLHKQVYIDLLNGILVHGLKKKLAEQIGTDPAYLSSILSLDDPDLPGEDFVAKLIAFLPAEKYLRDAILYHITEARRLKGQLQRQAGYYIKALEVSALVGELLALHHQASFDRTDLRAVQDHYWGTAFFAEQLLAMISPFVFPLDYAQVCLVLHDVYSAINRQGRALLLMLRAKEVLEVAEFEGIGDAQEWYRLWFNTVYALSITYRNINVPQKAALIFEEAVSRLPNSAGVGEYWQSYIYLDQLQVFAQTSRRFQVGDADYHGRQAEQTLRKLDPMTSYLVDLLIQKARLEAYRNYGEHRGTGRVLKQGEPLAYKLLDAIEHSPYGGAIHHSVVLFSVLRFFQFANQQDAIAEYLPRAWHLVTSAGLSHQQKRLNTHFSDLLKEAG